jgi:uncharacterized RDD family membrane protein YckC
VRPPEVLVNAYRAGVMPLIHFIVWTIMTLCRGHGQTDAMEEYDLIETPENVELERRLAGMGSRFTAGVLDTVYIVLVYLVLFVVGALFDFRAMVRGFSADTASGWGIALLILLAFAVYWFYFAFFELVMNGQTPGKRSVQIRVVKDGGGAITLMDIAIRNVMRAIDCQALYGVAGICMFATKKMQRLGDLAAGTIVVSEQLHDYRARTDKRKKVDWEPQMQAGLLRESGLTAAEYRVLSNYWARREELTLEARERLLPQLVLPILQRMDKPAVDRSPQALEGYISGWLEGATASEPPFVIPVDEGKDVP